MAKTPYPWAWTRIKPTMIYAGNHGFPDLSRPVAKFYHVDDAIAASNASITIDEQLATLRSVLPIIEQELKQRQASGLPGYIEPVRSAVERVKAAIAEAEGWT